MGTRADFYVGRGESAEWIGSVAYDGYPAGIDESVLTAKDENSFRGAVGAFLAASSHHSTTPSEGWPWPWKNSQTTDYAYAYDDGRVHASCFGHAWFDPNNEPEDNCTGEKVAVFPDMSDRKRVALGARSGMTIVVGPRDRSER